VVVVLDETWRQVCHYVEGAPVLAAELNVTGIVLIRRMQPVCADCVGWMQAVCADHVGMNDAVGMGVIGGSKL
jgi:hypothetical protein